MVDIKRGVKKQGKIITKKLGAKGYKNEMMVYSKKLPYTPTLISHNPKTKEIKIALECCKTFKQIPKKDKPKYYPQIKKTFNQFKRDTGFYHKDLAPSNIIVNEKTGKITLIDFEKLATTKKEVIDDSQKVNRIKVFRLLTASGII
tara:strand:- start:1648 stop:2085 length:438 start_codon:yes stop_codon:yes gene_type:complete